MIKKALKKGFDIMIILIGIIISVIFVIICALADIDIPYDEFFFIVLGIIATSVVIESTVNAIKGLILWSKSDDWDFKYNAVWNVLKCIIRCVAQVVAVYAVVYFKTDFSYTIVHGIYVLFASFLDVSWIGLHDDDITVVSNEGKYKVKSDEYEVSQMQNVPISNKAFFGFPFFVAIEFFIPVWKVVFSIIFWVKNARSGKS